MFIYEVFKVVSSTAPIYSGVDSKLTRLGAVKANNSVKACEIARKKLEIESSSKLYAHQVYGGM